MGDGLAHQYLHDYIHTAIRQGVLKKGDHVEILILGKNEYQLIQNGNQPTNYVIEKKTCPECTTKLTYDAGQPQTWDEPEQPSCLHCEECGYEVSLEEAEDGEEE
jgi:hypothetical protein